MQLKCIVDMATHFSICDNFNYNSKQCYGNQRQIAWLSFKACMIVELRHCYGDHRQNAWSSLRACVIAKLRLQQSCMLDQQLLHC